MHPNPRQRTRGPYRAKGKMHTNERDKRRRDGPDLRPCRTLTLPSPVLRPLLAPGQGRQPRADTRT
jgi:hypothetical protein